MLNRIIEGKVLENFDMLNRLVAVQECDARDDDKWVKAGSMIKISLQKPDFVNTNEV